jgi:hypothetical protein
VPIDAVSWEWKDDFMPESTATAVERPLRTAEDYNDWLAQGKRLAAEHNNRQWLLGDWLNEGDEEYNVKNLDIPSYLLIGSHPPNFWKDVSEKTDLVVGTLKLMALVARRFPDDKRIPQLSWSHHAECAPFEAPKRFEYLAACWDGVEKKSLGWLQEYIRQHEGTPEERDRISVPLRLPSALLAKLKDVAKYRGKTLDKLVFSICAKTVHDYIQDEERDISLELFQIHEEGIWPLSPEAEQHYKPKKRRRAA